MSRLPLRLGQWLLIVALLCATGMQWVALQSIAWGTMLVDNVRHAPLPVAIARTFDGDHPCRLCQTIAQGRKAERKAVVVPVIRFDLFLQPAVGLVWLATAPRHATLADCRAEARTEPPLLPPPRGRVG